LLDAIEGGRFEGEMAELLNRLGNIVDDSAKKQKGWPKTARGLSGQLRRLAPNIRLAGFELNFGQTSGTNSRRVVSIRKGGNPSVAPSQSVARASFASQTEPPASQETGCASQVAWSGAGPESGGATQSAEGATQTRSGATQKVPEMVTTQDPGATK